MKTKTIAFMLVSLFFVTSLTAQNYELKFYIVNDTGIDLFGVYVSESLNENWGGDIIPGDLFNAGDAVEVTIPISDETLCVHDIKVTDYAGEGVVFPELDFCEISVLTFFAGSDGNIYYKTE